MNPYVPCIYNFTSRIKNVMRTPPSTDVPIGTYLLVFSVPSLEQEGCSGMLGIKCTRLLCAIHQTGPLLNALWACAGC
jgi:hypothetical protein